MNPWLRSTLGVARRIYRRLNEKAGLIPGFSDLAMHEWMLRDGLRVEAYEQAINMAVKPGAIVVDVGAGTGLLAMLACRAGAARVYAIEESRIIDLARLIIHDNGFDDRVVLLHGRSTKIALPERADVVVSETIGSFVFSEEIVATLADARERFLKPAGVLIPDRIRIFLAPVESFEEGTGFWERPRFGFDYRAAAPCVDASAVDAARWIEPRHFLDEGALAYDLQFRTVSAVMDVTRTLTFTARRDGAMHGFVGYWDASLLDGVALRCAPGAPQLHWPPLLFRLPRGVPVRAGERITLRFSRKDRPGWQWEWEAEVLPSKAPG